MSLELRTRQNAEPLLSSLARHSIASARPILCRASSTLKGDTSARGVGAAGDLPGIVRPLQDLEGK